MTNSSLVRLPSSLLASDDYRALNDSQQQAVEARLCHCMEIAANGLNAATEQDAGLLEAIDDIELDALSIMSISLDTEKTVSPYIVHSSWTFECDRQAMTAYVTADTAEFLGALSLPITASHDDVRGWLKKWAQILQSVLVRFMAASSFTESIVQLIVIDALVAAYLVFAASVRLNSRIA